MNFMKMLVTISEFNDHVRLSACPCSCFTPHLSPARSPPALPSASLWKAGMDHTHSLLSPVPPLHCHLYRLTFAFSLALTPFLSGCTCYADL